MLIEQAAQPRHRAIRQLLATASRQYASARVRRRSVRRITPSARTSTKTGSSSLSRESDPRGLWRRRGGRPLGSRSERRQIVSPPPSGDNFQDAWTVREIQVICRRYAPRHRDNLHRTGRCPGADQPLLAVVCSRGSSFWRPSTQTMVSAHSPYSNAKGPKTPPGHARQRISSHSSHHRHADLQALRMATGVPMFDPGILHPRPSLHSRLSSRGGCPSRPAWNGRPAVSPASYCHRRCRK